MAVISILNERLHDPLNPRLALIEPGYLYVKSPKPAFAMPVVVHGIIVPPLAFSQVIPVLVQSYLCAGGKCHWWYHKSRSERPYAELKI